MTIRQTIDAEVSTNYNKYLGYCRQLYNGNEKYNDLMNESYLALIQMPEHKLTAFISSCKLPALIFKVIYFKHKNRGRRNSNLDDFNFKDISDIPQEPSEPAKDLSKSLEILKERHPAHFQFLNEILEKGLAEGHGTYNARHKRLTKVRTKLKEIYNEGNS